MLAEIIKLVMDRVSEKDKSKVARLQAQLTIAEESVKEAERMALDVGRSVVRGTKSDGDEDAAIHALERSRLRRDALVAEIRDAEQELVDARRDDLSAALRIARDDLAALESRRANASKAVRQGLIAALNAMAELQGGESLKPADHNAQLLGRLSHLPNIRLAAWCETMDEYKDFSDGIRQVEKKDSLQWLYARAMEHAAELEKELKELSPNRTR